LDATSRHLNEYGEVGLRTLALAYRNLDEQEYSDWNDEFQKAKTTVGPDRDAMLEKVSDSMERELILVGATAVEDKLQKGVGFIIIYGQYILILPPFYILIMFKFLFFKGASMH
jgi:phospholipid-translocating ATPase